MEKEKGKRLFTGLMFLVAVIWGMGFPITVNALEAGYSEGFMLSVRFIAAALFFGIIGRKQFETLNKAEVFGGLLSGSFLFLAFILQTYGVSLTTPTNSAMITSTYIIFVPFLTWVIFRSRPNSKVFFGAVLCCVGIFVISYRPGEISAFGAGDLLTFIGSIFFALHAVSIGYFSARGNSLLLNFFQMLMAGICSFVLLLKEGGVGEQLTLRFDLVWIAYLTILSTILAYMIQTHSLKYLNPTKMSLIGSTESVFAAFFSLMLGYERLSTPLIVGSVLVFLSVLLVELPEREKRKPLQLP